MRETETVVLGRGRFPTDVAVGAEFDVAVRGRVRRIEAEAIDVTGFTGKGEARAILEGEVYVELTVLRVRASTPEGHRPIRVDA